MSVVGAISEADWSNLTAKYEIFRQSDGFDVHSCFSWDLTLVETMWRRNLREETTKNFRLLPPLTLATMFRPTTTPGRLVKSLQRSYATRPHPLATRVTPRGPIPAGKTPPNLKPKQQRFSPLTLVLLATLTGSTTYALGRRESTKVDQVGKLEWKEPTREGLNTAVAELKAYFPEDCVAEDRDALIAHGWNDWGKLSEVYHFLELD